MAQWTELLDGWRGTEDKDWCVSDSLDHLLTLARLGTHQDASNEL